MKMALFQAQKAYEAGEVPVGAVVVKDGVIISRARNMREGKQNALCHAEILAIDKACRKLKSFRLDGCEIYVTLEPCPMCAGAICGARLSSVVFGASDKNYGCAGSKHNFFADPDFEHLAQVCGGVMARQCEELLQKFFVQARKRNRMKKLLGKHAKILPNNLSTNGGTNVDIWQEIDDENANVTQKNGGTGVDILQTKGGKNVDATQTKGDTNVKSEPKDLTTNDGVNAKILRAKVGTSDDVLQGENCEKTVVECEIDGEKYPFVKINSEEVVVAVVRRKNGANMLVLGGGVSDEEVVAFAKKMFAKGDKIVTKHGKFLV